MIRWLGIQRFAVIETLEVEFDEGFNVLTGETGAGKSIVVEALALLVGERASPDMIRSGEDTAVIQAVFATDDGREVAVRRELSTQGRNRVFIDGNVTTTAALKDLTGELVDIHGQHEHQTLLDPRSHLDLVDEYGRLQSYREAVASTFSTFSDARHRVERLELDERQRNAQIDLLTFQLGEIDRAAPRPAEDEELAASRLILANSEKVRRLCAESYGLLYEDERAVLASLSTLWRRVGELAAVDTRFAQYLEARDVVKSNLDELACFLRSYMCDLDTSPGALERVEDRLALIERLKKKYGPALADVIRSQDEFRKRLDELRNLHEQAAELHANLERARRLYLDAAGELSRERRVAAARLTHALEKELAHLAMEGTRCQIRFGDVALSEEGWTDRGVDEAELYLSPNVGEQLRPLAKIASGGELSRIMLALKSLASTDAKGKTLVFDEVDAGIGGHVAAVVGSRLRRLAEHCQVLCITHLPQIAACAQTHFNVAKGVQSDRTITTVERLDSDGRIVEIARMMGGHVLTESAKTSAKEMLDAAGKGPLRQSEANTKGESERAKAKGRPVA